MSKHTPGPWRFSMSGNGRRQISGKDGKQVCLLWNGRDTEYNKSLIEAAPELLEALKELRACIDDTRGKNAHDAVIKADDVINKAEGGK